MDKYIKHLLKCREENKDKQHKKYEAVNVDFTELYPHLYLDLFINKYHISDSVLITSLKSCKTIEEMEDVFSNYEKK